MTSDNYIKFIRPRSDTKGFEARKYDQRKKNEIYALYYKPDINNNKYIKYE